jgi:fermentation-respiration switch protein FrsA (DUF1100 family)
VALFQRHLIYPRAYDGHPPAADRRLPGASIVSVGTADGERLFAFWRPPAPGCGVVLSFHGNGSLPEGHASRFLSEPWRSRGWGVLAPAYRGYPGSTGSPSEDGLIADGAAALRFVEEMAPGAAILLHGHSLGAAVAIAVAEAGRHVGLYLEAPFDSLLHLVRLRFPILPSALLRDTWRSDRRIAANAAPVFIVHGDDDPVIPTTLAVALAAAAGPATRFEVLPGDHVSILGSRDVQAEAQFRSTRACEIAAVP